MFFSAILTGVFAALLVVVDGAAVPSKATVSTKASFLDSTNPFLGKSYFVSSKYAGKLQTTLNTFLARKDTLNAARVRSLQRTGTFLWITSVYHISNIATTITDARAQQKRTGQQPIIGLVLYNLPDRDCSGGQSTGEFTTASDGLNKYKAKFVDAFAVAISKAPDLTFAIILEPDSLGNLITNQNIPFCARAKSAYESGIAYAIAKLQQKNVFLYLDAAHGGWLGWDANLPLVAAEISKIVTMAQKITKGAKLRGFAINVSNFNPYVAKLRAAYTEYSHSFDESHYVDSLVPFLIKALLPTQFIVDQGRSGLQNSRKKWSEWCNVKAGFGIPPTTTTNHLHVDSIVWVKPMGESDGSCGPSINGKTAPASGMWWEEYVEQGVVLANPPLSPSWS